MELSPLNFSYLPCTKEYPNREKTIIEILIFWPRKNRLLCGGNSLTLCQVRECAMIALYCFLFVDKLLRNFHQHRKCRIRLLAFT